MPPPQDPGEGLKRGWPPCEDEKLCKREDSRWSKWMKT